MIKKISLVILIVSSLSIHAQNLFPVKLENCKTDRFCLDCGDVKASYSEANFAELLEKLNKSLNLQGINGAVKFQVLIDSNGNGCVLSHTDQSNHLITQQIITQLNSFNKWIPAITANKKEEKTSVNLIFSIKSGRISGMIERVDVQAFKKSFDEPRKPEIFNKTYAYKNENLKNYKITVWNSRNSNLTDNMNDNITIDKKGLIWLSAGDSLLTFNGKKFYNAGKSNEKGPYLCIESDNNDIKWMYVSNSIYSYDDKNWTKYDPKVIGSDGAYKIINNSKSQEVFFCSDKGLTIYKDGQWSNLNQNKVKELPSNRITFARRDSKNRIWIGTFSGSIVIDELGRATSFNDTETVLKGKCITSMDEDEKGNLYFSLYEFDAKIPGQVNRDEGIAVKYADGTIKQFTTSNSGMPFNHTNKVLYDRYEKVLWISTDRAGLVRYDLKDGWENYHNENSAIPTSYISTMTFDKKGNLYLATRQGLVKIERK
ncbi:ligand-binding sensor domain-containing protein [Pedobacter nutrimenti]|uniref:Two component regulator with propeller domain n=1 Tax=Pedobacter nutrimenti TaxID=1241337 RepID=A0A318UD77_9SPHI|nr:two-component regulator propeller domain-containing protein [Pedobacter nutrimenti]PYF74382.1 two component regulator with propeller domain [Pedobacter nutrimenti]